MGTLFLTKEARIYNGAKRAPSVNGAEKSGQLHVKDEIRTLSNTIHTHKHKNQNDWRPKDETRYYKTLKGTHRQNTLWDKLNQ